MRAKVIINENHKLLPEQKEILDKRFGDGGWVKFPVPSEGWNLDQMVEVKLQLQNDPIVFVSPIPYLIRELAILSTNLILIFHNDHREAKEITLPNGQKKIIHVVSKHGWKLV